MRIYLIIDETSFFQPDFIADFLKRTTDKVVGAALVVKVPEKNNIDLYLRRHWYFLRLNEICKLLILKLRYVFKNILRINNSRQGFSSVESVFQFFGIPYSLVQWDINQDKYLANIRTAKPDVIISSNSLIFGDELLNIPKICCLNRHSALLPSFGGLWPVFQAVRCDESFTGVSVHTMEKKIDQGVILAQTKIKIDEEDSVTDLYEKCFAVSANVVLEALNKIRKQDLSPVQQTNRPCYFSFPAKEHWREFRQKNKKFI
ncbi:MAG: hypothetical protein KC733_07195 [Candidatus Omnitrophica bacterium]|nr:hypothetical protein [Candidatus Omnitrophota bacterium]